MQAAEEKRQPVVEPQSALPALLALCISSVLPRRQHRRRRECHWGAGENIGTEEVFRPRVATCATNKVITVRFRFLIFHVRLFGVSNET